MSDIMETLQSHYKEIRVLIILVLSIVLLSSVYFFGSITSHLGDVDQSRFENRRRIELLEREVDRLEAFARAQVTVNWTRKDMQLYCMLFANANPGAKCPSVSEILVESYDAIQTPAIPRANSTQAGTVHP